MSKPTAKINQKAATRFAIGALVLAGIIYGIQAMTARGTDELFQKSFASAGYISAAKEGEDGYQAVIFDPSGKETVAPGYVAGSMDEPPVWRPDGDRLFFVSDRDNREPHIFRWNPADNLVERRTLDRRAKTSISFDIAGEKQIEHALVVSGGTVIEFDPKKGSSRQVLPPGKKDLGAGERTEEGGGGQFEAVYRGIGTSFRDARWGKGRNLIIATMRRETGDVLIFQDLNPPEPKKNPDGTVTELPFNPPVMMMSGERIDFDVDPVSGKVVFTVMNFQFPNPDEIPPQFIKDGKVVLPWRHAVGMFDPEAGMQSLTYLVQSAEPQPAFAQPRFSPDGSEVLVEVGEHQGGAAFRSRGFVLMKPEPAGGTQPEVRVAGNYSDLAWHPTGQQIIGIERVSEKNGQIFTMNRDGSNKKTITTSGNYMGPRFSPVSK